MEFEGYVQKVGFKVVRNFGVAGPEENDEYVNVSSVLSQKLVKMPWFHLNVWWKHNKVWSEIRFDTDGNARSIWEV